MGSSSRSRWRSIGGNQRDCWRQSGRQAREIFPVNSYHAAAPAVARCSILDPAGAGLNRGPTPKRVQARDLRGRVGCNQPARGRLAAIASSLNRVTEGPPGIQSLLTLGLASAARTDRLWGPLYRRHHRPRVWVPLGRSSTRSPHSGRCQRNITVKSDLVRQAPHLTAQCPSMGQPTCNNTWLISDATPSASPRVIGRR
jgi:hypothetical protein